MAKIMPTAPRLRWKLIQSVSISAAPGKPGLEEVLNNMEEKGWSHYAFLRSGAINTYHVVFRRLEHIGEEDRVERLIDDNRDLPFIGAQRVND